MIQVRLEWIGRGLDAFAQCGDFFQFIGPDDGIHVRNVLLNIGAIAFDKATRDNQALGAAGFLVLGHFEDGVDGFLLGRIDKAAGIDHDNVGIRRMRRKLMAAGGELAHHDLSIDEVFGASETYETYFQGR